MTGGFNFRFSTEQQEFLAFFENDRPAQNYFRRIQFRERFRDECNFFDIESDVLGQPTNIPRKWIADYCYNRIDPGKKAVFLWATRTHANCPTASSRSPKGLGGPPGDRHGCVARANATENKNNYCDYSNWFALNSIRRVKPEVVIIGQNLGHDVENMKSLGAILRNAGVKKVIFTGPSPHWLTDFSKIVAYNIIPNHTRRTRIGLDPAVVDLDNKINSTFPAVEGNGIFEFDR